MPTSINLRIVLWMVLGLALLANYQQWTHDYPAAPPPSEIARSANGAPLGSNVSLANPNASGQSAGSAAGTAGAASTASAASAALNAPPTLAAPAAIGAAPVAAPETTPVAGSGRPAATPAASPVRSVHVRTDVLDLDISLQGGEIRRSDLLAYPLAKNAPNVPVRLLNSDSSESQFLMQSGLAGATPDSAPTHLALLTSASDELQLAPGQQELDLPLTWADGKGVTVTKTYHFHRGSYEIGLDYRVDNASSAPFSFAPYAQILRYNQPTKSSYFDPSSSAYKGPAYFDGTKFEKLDITKNPVLDRNVRDGYVAALQHDFVAAIVPPNGLDYRYTLQTQGNEFALKAQGPTVTLAPGASASVGEKYFVGPKIQKDLDLTHPRLDLVADYGWLRIIATPLFWALAFAHRMVSNWGIAIILVTLLLKLIFYPLAEASGRSMAKMKTMAPRIAALRETYKGDPQQLNKATMELYQKEKINPVAGCLPMLIQIPVFIAFYWVLRDSVELRQAPFGLWINDLSARDPFFILPAIMMVAMFVQYKINPQMGTDPMQQKLFMFMPLVMSATFAFFPAGLVLYWVTNTVLSILQQWNINRRLAARAVAKKT